MTVQISKAAGLNNWRAVDMIRLKDPLTGEYLHLSGTGRTKNVAWSWLGTHQQARTLRERVLERGEGWPWRATRRDEDT